MTELPPPILAENGSYENWRNEIQMWQITTTMEPKRQALAVRTKLCGKVREVALKLDASDLNNDSGMSFLIDALDASFRKKTKKWDVPNSSANQIKKDKFTNDGQQNIPIEVIHINDKQSEDSSLSATDRARQRAAQLSAKLAAEGKYQMQPLSLLPKSLPDQFNKNKPPPSSVVPSLLNIQAAAPHQVAPEVKKMDNGNSFAEFNINDVCARPFLTRSSTRDLIAQQSGAAISLRGRFLTQEDKRQAIITGAIEKPLVLMIQANVAAKVQVALHKIMEVCRNYEKFGADNNFNNYGLSINTVNSTHHFVQEKLFVGVDNIHSDFNLREKLAGENGANFSFMVQQTGAKVFLRGRGSGYLEPNSGRESFEALHIYISHPRQDGLDMARQLCESLIETVKTQYQEWGLQRITQPPNPSLEARYRLHTELRYPTYPQNNGYNTTTYAAIPSLMSKEVKLPVHRQEEDQTPANTTAQTPRMSVPPPAVLDYRLSQAPITVNENRPHFSHTTASVNELRPPESNFDANRMFSEKNPFEETFQQRPGDHNASPNEHQRFHETDNREKKSDRSSRRRHRSRDKRSRSHSKSPTNRSRSKSPETKKTSRSRESKSKAKDSPRKSPNHKESSPVRRVSPHRRRESPPGRRESPPGRRESPPGRRESPPGRRESPPGRSDSPPVCRESPPIRRESPPIRRDSPSRRKESPPVRKEERTKRRFTEEPKKKRKFSEDPRLLEQAKVETILLADSPEREIHVNQSSREYLQVEPPPSDLPPPKLQFRSKKGAPKKEPVKKPKSILKMAPPPMLPIVPKKINGLSKSVTISPAGLSGSARKMTSSKNDIFKSPPPRETLKPPQAPQKVLKMGALSSLSMYEGDSDEDD